MLHVTLTPQKRFEIINTAMTAINSHVILPIARDCARQHGDLWIIYMGNNEMVGPFGAATVFGAKAPPWWIVRLNLALQETRVGQLLMATVRKLTGQSKNLPSWGGMGMFNGNRVLPDDPRRQTVYNNFQRNLTDILKVGLRSGVDILLSTVAVNLKDSPPFASLVASNLPAADRLPFEQLCADGSISEQTGDFAKAARDYAQAGRLASQSADVQYQWGECLLHLTNLVAAKEHFQLACDDDTLPFRADSHINGVIERVGERLASPHLALFDAVTALATNTATGILGDETFYEHVHLNFNGNYRLARAWASAVEKFLPDSLRRSAKAEWASQAQCEQRLGLTDWDRYNVTIELAGRRQQPPLNSLPNNGPLLNELLAQSAKLKHRMQSVTNRNQARDVYVAALQLWPNDYSIRANFAEFLQDIGDNKTAVEQWQQVRERFPQAYAPYYQLGRLAADRGQFDQAKQLLEQTVAMQPGFAPGWFDLGSVQAATSNYDLAITAFEHALRFEPQNSKYCFYDGLALAMAGRRSEAIERYRQAVRFDPNNWRAHYELGGLLGQEGNIMEAKTESEAAIRLNPAFPISHLNLGLALTKLGDLKGAEHEFQETLRLDPGNPQALDYLTQVRGLKENKK